MSSTGNPIFKIGDMVFLNRKNITTARPTLKLDQRMLGPFKIIGSTSSPLAFKLDLPPSMSGIHPVFHVKLLEPVRPGHIGQQQDPPPRIETKGEQVYIIDKILDSRISDSDHGYDYLVHWRDFSSDEDSWEPWEQVWETSAYKAFRRQHQKDPRYHFPPSSAHTSANRLEPPTKSTTPRKDPKTDAARSHSTSKHQQPTREPKTSQRRSTRLRGLRL